MLKNRLNREKVTTEYLVCFTKIDIIIPQIYFK